MVLFSLLAPACHFRKFINCSRPSSFCVLSSSAAIVLTKDGAQPTTLEVGGQGFRSSAEAGLEQGHQTLQSPRPTV